MLGRRELAEDATQEILVKSEKKTVIKKQGQVN
jgi:hypothetical protein